MKLETVGTVRLLTVQLTEREARVLRAALSVAEVEAMTVNARSDGLTDLHDDDVTDLYGAFNEALKSVRQAV
jgi:hypothetical protein